MASNGDLNNIINLKINEIKKNKNDDKNHSIIRDKYKQQLKTLIDQNNEKDKIDKNNKNKIWIDKYQVEYLELIRSITNFEFIKSENRNEIIETINKVIKHDPIEPNIKNRTKNHIKNIINMPPSKLYDLVPTNKYRTRLNTMKNILLPNQNLKCYKCDINVVHKFNLCLSDYDEGINKTKQLFYELLRHRENYDIYVNFLKLIKRDIKINIYEIENKHENQASELKINNLVHLLDQKTEISHIVSYHITSNPQLYENINVPKMTKINNKNVIKNINEYMLNKSYFKLKPMNIKLENCNKMSRIDLQMLLKPLKWNIEVIDFILSEMEECKLSDDLYQPCIKNMIDAVFEDTDISHTYFQDLFNNIYAKYDIQNLMINKVFPDNFYNDNVDNLKYDIYGEIFNEVIKCFLPFVIFLNMNETTKYVKQFYCIISGITCITLNKVGNRATKQIFDILDKLKLEKTINYLSIVYII